MTAGMASAAEVIDTIEAWRKKIYPVHGVHYTMYRMNGIC